MLTELEPKPYLLFGIINNEKYNEQVRLDIQGSLRMQNPEKLQKSPFQEKNERGQVRLILLVSYQRQSFKGQEESLTKKYVSQGRFLAST